MGLEPNLDKYKTKLPSGKSIKITEDFKSTDPLDNPYVKFTNSIIAVFFWIFGRWDTLEKWNFWPVYVLAISKHFNCIYFNIFYLNIFINFTNIINLVGGISLVIILQNLLIAFMSDIFAIASTNAKLASLKYKADLIADYEATEKLFSHSKEQRYIYHPENFNYRQEWLNKNRKYHKSLAKDIKNQLLILKNSNSELEF